MKVFILSGDIQSGKTTTLMKWASSRRDVHGILTPVSNGNRMFYDIASGDYFPMEAPAAETDPLRVGRFLFSRQAFSRAETVMMKGLYSTHWLVVDEIGPLELRGEGFFPVINEILKHKDLQLNLLLVVRAPLLQEVIRFFCLDGFPLQILKTNTGLFHIGS